jgi:hypothetical protein
VPLQLPFQEKVLCCYLTRFAEAALAGAGGGPSGWQTPVVPPSTEIKHKQGRTQMVELVHALPQAVPAAAGVASCEAETQTADRITAMDTASNNFLSISNSPFFRGLLRQTASIRFVV